MRSSTHVPWKAATSAADTIDCVCPAEGTHHSVAAMTPAANLRRIEPPAALYARRMSLRVVTTTSTEQWLSPFRLRLNRHIYSNPVEPFQWLRCTRNV